MFVRDRMSSPAVTIPPDTVFRDASRLMRTHGIRRLPVVDEDGVLVGIVCEHDLLTVAPSQPGSLSVWELNRLRSSVQIEEIMTEDVISTTADTPIEDVARLMTDNKVGGLPVLDDEGRVIGVITETDIFRTFVEMFAGGRPGLRLTLVVPAGKEILRELGKAVSESGGHIVSVGSFEGDAPDEREIVVKIRGARKHELLETLEALGDHVVDAREVWGMGVDPGMKEKTVGLIVNPVAGMGGSVGLKGTDGEMHEKAMALGAEPVTPGRTREMLAHLERVDEIAFLAAPGRMGATYLEETGIPATVIGEIGEATSAQDTKRIAEAMVDRGAALLIFVGGDGTARDITDAVGTSVPVVGVPAGVKVFSAAFALSARAAADMVDAFVAGTSLTEEEVLDIDEEAFRDDRLASRLYGTLLVPEVRTSLQPAKAASNVSAPAEEVKRDIARFFVETMDPDTLYLLGPGTTLRAITDELGLSKTLLGVDAAHGGALVGEDLNEAGILGLFEEYGERKIVVTPIGGNGFIFGRGSKQFTPTVIRGVGREHVTVVGTQRKVRALDCLRVDTGDAALDETLSGYIKVIVGYREWMMVEVRC